MKKLVVIIPHGIDVRMFKSIQGGAWVEASAEQEAASKLAQEKQLVDRQLYEKLSEAVETIGYTYDMQTFAEK